MKIRCISGYYKFYPEDSLDLVRLKEVFNIELVPYEDYYTFEALRDMKPYSITGYLLGLGIGKFHFSGTKPEVLAKNLLVYNMALKNITEMLLSVRVYSVPKDRGDFYLFDTIPQAGGLLNGIPFSSFFGAIDFDTSIIRVGEVGLW